MTPIKEILSLTNSKRIKECRYQKINNNILVDAGFNIIGKKIKKWISSITGSGITLTKNGEKDLMKVIAILENSGILTKGQLKKLLVKE